MRRRAAWGLLLLLGLPAPSRAQLDDSCVVSALNRSAYVQSDGSWVLPNIPANQGQVRVRATCVEADGTTRAGQSQLVAVPANGVIRTPEISFAAPRPIPVSLRLTAPSPRLGALGETVQLAATATYPDGSTGDLTPGESGTDYRVSNPAIVTVDANGRVTARGSGNVLVSAVNEGALAVLEIQVVASGDSDGDGLPDDWEIVNGLDPNDPVDALDDADGDGLSAADEFQRGLDPANPDTDGDGLSDGREVSLGTDPRLADTDGDGLRDGLEVRTGSDPLDPDSFDLAEALSAIEVTPAVSVLAVNTVIGEASRQVRVTGRLIDGFDLDITSRRYGTGYASSDLQVANFGADDGRVYAGEAGQATVTVSNGGFSATAEFTVQAFSPTALALLPLPGFANGVAANGNHMYVAAGEAGLLVVDVSNPAVPVLIATLDTPGNANDVRVVDGLAYVADGSGGLLIADVGTPASPALLGRVATPGAATDLAVAGTWVFVADESGLRSIDASDPASPLLAGGVDLPPGARARGVDVSPGFAVVAASRAGVFVIDISNPAAPFVAGSTHTRPGSSHAADVVVRGRLAYVADGADGTVGGLKVIDFREPSTPVVVGATSNAFGLTSVALERNFAFASDYVFSNAVPIFAIADSAGAPLFRATLDFEVPPAFRDDQGNGVDVRDGLVFLAATSCCAVRDNGVTGSSFLHIGRYARLEDDLGVAPAVAVTAPAAGSSILERRVLPLRAEARDDVRVEAVQFRVNGMVLGTDYASPYEMAYTVPVGLAEVRIGAVATDGGGNQAAAEEVLVTVIPDGSPTVELLAPAAGSSWTEGISIPVAASASDDIGITSVSFYRDGTLQGILSAPPYRLDIEVPLGAATFTLSAVATDTVGQTATATRTLTILSDDPPASFLVDPADGTPVVAAGLVQILAGADDDVGIAAVRLLVNGAVEAEDTAPPYQFEIQVPLAATELRIAAVAVDTAGQETTSAERTLPVASDDPGTLAAGSVVDENGAPLAGARVACRGVLGTSGAGGAFLIAGVPTALGPVRCTATFRDAEGRDYAGRSAAVAPVPGSVTAVGTIAVELLRGFLYPGAKLPAGGGAHSVKIGDLNGDGVLDLATADWYSWTVSVFLGTADGGFQARRAFDVGQSPEDLSLADFDGDGDLDIATANKGSDDVTVLAGDGDGTFQLASTLPACDGANRTAAADFDGDGDADLAVACDYGAQMVVFANGGGALSRHQTLASGDAADLEAADVDGDGKPDLVLAGYSSGATVFSGVGDGTFQAGQGAGAAPAAGVAVADLNGDGRPDLAVSNGFYGRVQIVLAQAGGGWIYGPALEAGNDTNAVLVADLNADGILDIAAANADSGDLSYFAGTGGGAFQTQRVIPAGAGPRDLAAADLNADGLVDLVTANYYSEDVSILHGRGSGKFTVSSSYPAGITPSHLALGDFNADGAPDVAAASSDSDEVAVLLGRGDGTFIAERRFATGVGPIAVVAADVSGDGRLDLVTANDRSDDLSVLLGNGDGTFAAEQRQAVGECPESVAVGDVNGDGVPDLAAPNACDNDVSVLLGTGGGAFAAQARFAAGEWPQWVAIGPLDGDGFGDLAVANYDSHDVSILLSRGDGTFQSERRVALFDASFPTALVLADLDGDGIRDVAVNNSNSPDYTHYATSVLLGNGDGTFQAERTFTTGFFPWAVTAADVNGDGAPDLVFARQSANDVSVLLGRGDGTFQPPQFYAAGECPLGVAAGDLDGDGLVDLLTASSCSDDVSVLLHR